MYNMDEYTEISAQEVINFVNGEMANRLAKELRVFVTKVKVYPLYQWHGFMVDIDLETIEGWQFSTMLNNNTVDGFKHMAWFEVIDELIFNG